MTNTPLTSVGIAADKGFFQPPTNNPLTANGSIGLTPRTVIEPGTVTFPAAITFNQYGQVIGAIAGDGTGFNGLLSQSVVADYGMATLPVGNTSSLITFTTSALQKTSCILIQPISTSNASCGITGIYPKPDLYNEQGTADLASSNITVIIPQTNNPISGFYWAIINPSKYVFSYVNPVGVFTLKNVNGLKANINCADYGISNSSLAAYFLSVSSPSGNSPVYASLVATEPNSNTISLFTTGQCDVNVMVINTSLNVNNVSGCVLLNGGNITAPGSTTINNTSCFEIPSLTASANGFITCFSSLVIPTSATPTVCGTIVSSGATIEPSSWMQPGKGQIGSTYVYPNSESGSVPLLGLCYINVFQSTEG
jgi:hypothetical protein